MAKVLDLSVIPPFSVSETSSLTQHAIQQVLYCPPSQDISDHDRN